VKNTISAAALILFAITLGCGSGSSNNGKGPSNANIAGNWKIVLAENQAAIFPTTADNNDTRIAIVFTQSGSILATDPNQEIWAGNVACEGPGGGFWSAWGGWVSQDFSLESGAQVSGQAVSFTLRESQLGVTSSTGELTFTGAVQVDGSIAGTVTDSCVLTNGNPTANVNWSASTMTTFPPTLWP
jgi:hypothetical protein